MEREYQEKIWDYDITHNRDNYANISRYETLMGLIRKHIKSISKDNSKDKRLLEIGFWSGYLFEKVHRDIECYGIDISNEIINSAKKDFHKKNINAQVSKQSIEETNFENDFFDIIVAIEVIEHLPNLIKGIKEINRILKPGGVFIGSVPANENLIENTVFCPYCGKTFHKVGHHHSFSEEKLKTIFESNGFKCDIKKVFFIETQSSLYRLIYPVLRKVLDIIDRKTKRFNGNFVFVAKKYSNGLERAKDFDLDKISIKIENLINYQDER